MEGVIYIGTNCFAKFLVTTCVLPVMKISSRLNSILAYYTLLRIASMLTINSCHYNIHSHMTL